MNGTDAGTTLQILSDLLESIPVLGQENHFCIRLRSVGEDRSVADSRVR